MKLIYEKQFGDGSSLRVQELQHPILGISVPAIKFDAGGGKGLTAFLADETGQEFVVEFTEALMEYISEQKISDSKNAIALVKGN